MDEKEVGLLCLNLGGMAAQLECEEMASKNMSLYAKPHWVSDKVGLIVYLLYFKLTIIRVL